MRKLNKHKRHFIFLIAVGAYLSSNGQASIQPSNSVFITGKVKKEVTIRIADLDTFKNVTLENVAIIDGKGAVEETIKTLKGIPLKEFFKNIEFQVSNHKALNGYYLVFTATDNFKLTLSWNELFHSVNCTNYYIVVQEDGKKLSQLPERILVMEINDSKKGHKRIEGLKQIRVAEAE